MVASAARWLQVQVKQCGHVLITCSDSTNPLWRPTGEND